MYESSKTMECRLRWRLRSSLSLSPLIPIVSSSPILSFFPSHARRIYKTAMQTLTDSATTDSPSVLGIGRSFCLRHDSGSHRSGDGGRAPSVASLINHVIERRAVNPLQAFPKQQRLGDSLLFPASTSGRIDRRFLGNKFLRRLTREFLSIPRTVTRRAKRNIVPTN